MHCELAVPGLFGAKSGMRLAALELLLARGRSRATPAQRMEGWLHDAFDLEEGPFPAGAFTLLGCGTDPGESSWARADPVHLRVMRDRMVVVPVEAFEVSREEADALCGALGRHFPDLDFTACEPRRWCARFSGVVDSGNPLEKAGHGVDLPREAASLLNEAQMVLHGHPVNEAREARGEPAVNSIWLWGAGRVTSARCPWQSVAADDPAIRGAARLAGARHRALPRSARDWLERLPEDGRHLAVLDSLRAPIALANADQVRAAIEALEREWFGPLLAELRAGRIGMVTLHVPDGAEAVSFEAIRGDLRRFWRRPRALARFK